jgi:alkanesulfonate monooxygenase SsuD/methylene tetrahydromethanopterin reductase-like flavin-dependent oxidoreductase (luciferase family)
VPSVEGMGKLAASAIRFDLRTPDFGRAGAQALYSETLEMAGWADAAGFGSIVLSEHHVVADGYLPSPLPMAGAIVGRTRRAAVLISALLAPLYNPVKLAEDLAVLDLLSDGRVTTVAGLGYRPAEYRALGVDFRRRGKLFDECLEIVLAAFGGEPIEVAGESFTVTPSPRSRVQDILQVGGSSPAAARRAARFGLTFAPPLHDAELNALYEAACRELGNAPLPIQDPGEPWMLFVSDDPERAWAEIGPHWLHDAMVYASWQTEGPSSRTHAGIVDLESLKKSGVYRIWTPEECVGHAREAGEGASFCHFPLGGGIPPDLGWKSLELFAARVLPELG